MFTANAAMILIGYYWVGLHSRPIQIIGRRGETGKSELRRYTAIFMLKDKEIGKFSNDLIVSCTP
ncbi:hypothetical protein [Methylobacter psychrophilus]|uniref:hypothetical protein n=1 Tax=Methylobacter psychrophilus TaxID=96941 RepID=UPI0021D5109B|nr:hypothetical protein [Methylobacter psychrophilus]